MYGNALSGPENEKSPHMSISLKRGLPGASRDCKVS